VIAVEGAGSILFHANHGRTVQSSLALAIGLGVALAALLLRRRQPLATLAIVLTRRWSISARR
jgi:uncharacterized membrane protein